MEYVFSVPSNTPVFVGNFVGNFYDPAIADKVHDKVCDKGRAVAGDAKHIPSRGEEGELDAPLPRNLETFLWLDRSGGAV